jgi:segregation and condensation protein A
VVQSTLATSSGTKEAEDTNLPGRTQPLVAVDGFSGPFDLLVRLIERRELDLLTISLARVTDQYLEQLSSANLRDPEHLTAFLVVAAKLLLIKSTLLLPTKEKAQPTDSAPADPTDLVERLRLYRAFRLVADALGARHDAGLRGYPHAPVAYRPSVPRPAAPISATLLREAYLAALRRPKSTPDVDLPTETRMTVAEAIDLLQVALDRFTRVQFSDLVGEGRSRQRYVATFLAVLELTRLGFATVEQEHRFGEIVVEKQVLPAIAAVPASPELSP